MNFTERIEYIWAYYKLHILFALCSILLLSFTASSFLSSKNDITVNIMVVDNGKKTEEFVDLLMDINEESVDYQYKVDYVIHSGGKMEDQSYEQVQKLIANLATGLVDIMIVDQDLYVELKKQEAYLPIKEVLSLKTENNDLEIDDLYGIKTTDIAALKVVKSLKDKVICFPVKSQKKEFSRKFIKKLLNN
jgi:hypothetical protein